MRLNVLFFFLFNFFFFSLCNWFVGDKKYFNTALEEFKVMHPNRTSDYTIKDGSDGVEIIVCMFFSVNNDTIQQNFP